ncbi:MAG TPA: DUF4290 domain-containing protein [Candidatus Avibacteroides excrementipullorum]|jgi:hypothetical protein|nr:DUF4290 domain-containing protein [Candidatus Avibacteroides excrementipullorum]
MKYNTQEKRLPLPEYGRSVQNMIDYAVTIKDRSERQRCANTIITIMGNMFTHLRDVPDFKHKLWDHLAIMSDFKLDIDYPYEIVRKESLSSKPERLTYNLNRIHFRHYGRNLEAIIRKAADMPEGDERDALINLLANNMKKNYYAWNKDNTDEDKIIEDLRLLSDGKIDLKRGDIKFFDQRNNNNNRKFAQKNAQNGYNRNNQQRRNVNNK